MAPAAGNGHDASGAKDELAREPLARQIYECLKPAEANWSVRVGLFGSWGLGKTTVADWIRKWAAEEGHVAVNFKIAAENKDTLFHALSVAIYDALKDAGVEIENTLFSKTLREARNWAASKGKNLSGLVPNYYGAGGVISSASESLQFGEGDLAKIRSALVEQKRRIIIVIDDIDRLDASALPRVLLIVRDVLDLPGFSFLLPFDEAPVIAALQKHISTEGSGEGFLEKILDFQFRLPPLSEEQQLFYFRKCMAEAADFFPTDAIFRLVDILPGTPRRLKSLARHIGLLRESIARHGSNEVNWRLLLYSAILRQEDERFASRFLDHLLSGEDGFTFSFIGADDEKKKRAETLASIFEQAEVKSLAKKDRLSEICKFGSDQFSRMSHQWSYETVALLDRPPAMTQKELIQVLDQIKKKPTFDASELSDLLSSDSMSFVSGLDRLATTMGSLYRNTVVAKIEAFTEDDREVAEAKLLASIAAFERVVAIASQLPAPSRRALFCSLYDVVTSFKDSERDGEQNVHREVSIFDKLISAANQREIEQIDAHIQKPGKRDSQVLVDEITRRLAKRIANDLVDRFRRKSVFAFLRLKNQSLYTKILTQPDGPLWSGDTGELWSAVLAQASDDPVIQRNAAESLEVFSTLTSIDSSSLSDAICRVWEAATARPVGKMWQEELLQRRKQLTKIGLNAGRLVVPAWLNPL
ncbi:P-loop NTPase fold protein [Bradyrhizobium erythrophlei]|uniref:KAP family P-loop domain-containing protein n=1 Tax=Bradyrhizobium erythrophlei TaxID=1437360 RepID=A0A1M5HGH7_9BRAD|nr:P-loop NTPase fold protein [Bradyrhizobium erythrophlei]SHG15031.1 KAP family P-loop domain-containing protein [Bradyrhizobium erythrophlei]